MTTHPGGDGSLTDLGILTDLGGGHQGAVGVTPSIGSHVEQLEDDDMGSCSGRWGAPNHLLFQLAHAAMMVAFLSPSTIKGVVMLNATLVLAFLMMSGWAWAVICAPDVFSWNFSFMVINSVQMLVVLYRVRPVKFSAELEDVYKAIFQPLKLPRADFKKLVDPDICAVLSLQPGEMYAKHGLTRCDRLGLLITGSVRVLNQGQVLHHVKDKQFLDSPEFESTAHYDEKFHVTIMAETPCRYVFWQRHSLEYLFAKEPYLATVMGTVIGRDITNKLYILNEKVRIARGARVDIRLPSVSSAILSAKNSSHSNHSVPTGADSNNDATTLTATSAGGDSAYDLCAGVEVEGEEGAYCSLLPQNHGDGVVGNHSSSKTKATRGGGHHHYDSSPYHTCDVSTEPEQMVTCAIL